MKTIVSELIVNEIEIFCDCGGRLISTGIVHDCVPLIYPHICQDCGKEYGLDEYNPKRIYTKKNDFEYQMKIKYLKEKGIENEVNNKRT